MEDGAKSEVVKNFVCACNKKEVGRANFRFSFQKTIIMGLRDIGATLPPGFRFYPNDEELVCHYLYKKITNEEVLKGTLVEIDLHTCEPWQLPGRSPPFITTN
jgi:hypothetical protein